MFLSDLSIKRPIMMSMFLIVFLLFGAIAYFNMSVDLMPKVDIPYVTIQTVYAGAGPKEIETQITKKIEDAVSSISRIDNMTSYSMEGVSFVIIKFELGKDADVANQETKDKVDKILNDLPDDADLPVIEKLNLNEKPIVEVVLSGDLSPTELWELADKKLSDRFSQVEGVARTDITGGQEREIQVVLDDRVVFENRLSLSSVAQILSANNFELPSGTFRHSSQEYTLRLEGEYPSIDELKKTEIPTAYGNKPLGDIAEVADVGAEVRERSSYFNNIEKFGNDNIVVMSIIKNSEGNTVEIVQKIKELIPELDQMLPGNTKLEIVTDKSIFIKSTINDTVSTILLGILLTGLVLLIFLHDVRSTIIVAMAMPMSIISAFLFMNLFGFTKNMMSMMGLSTAVGVLVSNSVVVLENIFKHKQQGLGKKEAAAIGTSEVVVAVIAATATNIAVFLPVANMSGLIGQFFKQFALTVTFATIFSLIISFTLTPMMASLILPDKKKKLTARKSLGDRIEAMMTGLENWYKKILAKILHNKKISFTILVLSILVLVSSFMSAGKIGFEFVPLLDEGDILVEVELPIGYNLDATSNTLQTISNRLKKYPEVKHLLTSFGQLSQVDQGVNMASMSIKLVDATQRQNTTEEMANKFIEDLSDVPNALIRIRAISSMTNSSQAPILFYLKGHDINTLEKLNIEVIDKIKDIPGMVNLNTSSRSGKPEISIIPDRKKIADAGLNITGIALQLRGALTGMIATQYRERGEEYDVRVMIADSAVDTPEEIANLPISANGKTYTISQLGDVEFTKGVSKIMHIDKYKAVEISAATAPGVPMGDVMNQIEARVDSLNFPVGYRMEWGGTAEIMKDTIIDMLVTLIIAFVLTYMLLAAILENLTQPLLILGSFPFALVGVIYGMILSGLTMNIISMMAIVMLLGIVVNNAILILDYFNVLVREKKMSVTDALIEACPAKLRPILMSTLAIILGMLPMALGMGDAGREMRMPMGVVSIGGLVVSTLLTLVVIPVIYNMMSKLFKSKRGEQHA